MAHGKNKWDSRGGGGIHYYPRWLSESSGHLYNAREYEKQRVVEYLTPRKDHVYFRDKHEWSLLNSNI